MALPIRYSRFSLLCFALLWWSNPEEYGYYQPIANHKLELVGMCNTPWLAKISIHVWRWMPFLGILSWNGQMTVKVEVNDPDFQHQPRKYQDAYLVQIWVSQLKSMMCYHADKEKFTDGQDRCKQWQYPFILIGQGRVKPWASMNLCILLAKYCIMHPEYVLQNITISLFSQQLCKLKVTISLFLQWLCKLKVTISLFAQWLCKLKVTISLFA